MTIHTQLSAEVARQLAPKLRPKYLALTTERFVLEEPESVAVATASVYPDVAVSEAQTGAAAAHGETATIAAPLQLATQIPAQIPHVTVEIHDVENRQLVTAIEVLSPSNKSGNGRQEYLLKRQRLLRSTVHLIEIDLLREGHRVPMQQSLPPAPYFVLLSRVEKRPMMDVWPIASTEKLPTVPVPLLPGDVDVMLDLQTALTNIYDLLGYDLAIDYKKAPPVRISPNDQAWINDTLRDWRTS